MEIHYSIIVPAFNEEKFLGKTLENINSIMQELTTMHGELIVVDNNSSDKTAEIASAAGARVVYEKINCIARARNTGAKSANGKFLVFIDADTIASTPLVMKALDSMNSGKICGGGTLLAFDREDIPFIYRIFKKIWESAVKVVPLAAGSFVFCLKSAWHDCGGFDEFLYASEEVAFSRKLHRWGRKTRMKFIVLDIPVITSARKMEYYSGIKIVFYFFLFLLFPFTLRSKKLCGIWYERK